MNRWRVKYNVRGEIITFYSDAYVRSMATVGTLIKVTNLDPDHNGKEISIESMTSMSQDKNTILYHMDSHNLEELWEELKMVPFEMAEGGRNKGKETIQHRFYMWNKGTPVVDIEEHILMRLQ